MAKLIACVLLVALTGSVSFAQVQQNQLPNPGQITQPLQNLMQQAQQQLPNGQNVQQQTNLLSSLLEGIPQLLNNVLSGVRNLLPGGLGRNGM